jgi:hypothetical protein
MGTDVTPQQHAAREPARQRVLGDEDGQARGRLGDAEPLCEEG